MCQFPEKHLKSLDPIGINAIDQGGDQTGVTDSGPNTIDRGAGSIWGEAIGRTGKVAEWLAIC